MLDPGRKPQTERLNHCDFSELIDLRPIVAPSQWVIESAKKEREKAETKSGGW